MSLKFQLVFSTRLDQSHFWETKYFYFFLSTKKKLRKITKKNVTNKIRAREGMSQTMKTFFFTDFCQKFRPILTIFDKIRAISPVPKISNFPIIPQKPRMDESTREKYSEQSGTRKNEKIREQKEISEKI